MPSLPAEFSNDFITTTFCLLSWQGLKKKEKNKKTRFFKKKSKTLTLALALNCDQAINLAEKQQCLAKAAAWGNNYESQRRLQKREKSNLFQWLM